jgi:hypothetical protein
MQMFLLRVWGIPICVSSPRSSQTHHRLTVVATPRYLSCSEDVRPTGFQINDCCARCSINCTRWARKKSDSSDVPAQHAQGNSRHQDEAQAHDVKVDHDSALRVDKVYVLRTRASQGKSARGRCGASGRANSCARNPTIEPSTVRRPHTSLTQTPIWMATHSFLPAPSVPLTSTGPCPVAGRPHQAEGAIKATGHHARAAHCPREWLHRIHEHVVRHNREAHLCVSVREVHGRARFSSGFGFTVRRAAW